MITREVVLRRIEKFILLDPKTIFVVYFWINVIKKLFKTAWSLQKLINQKLDYLAILL